MRKFDPENNEKFLKLYLDLIEKEREKASVRQAMYKQKMEKYFNNRVKDKRFQPGDLVLRLNEMSRKEGNRKVDPNWKGPCMVSEARKFGSYKLKKLDGQPIPRSWNVVNLKKFHV